MMNQIIIEGPELTNIRIQVRDLDDAIEKLCEIKASQKRDRLNSIQRFKGIIQSADTQDANEEEWYRQ